MKGFLKIFLIAFVCFAVSMGVGFWAFSKYYNTSADVIVNNDPPEIVDSEGNREDSKGNTNEDTEVEKSELEKLVESSKRINVALLGMEGPRTDTIVFASFDPESKKLDLISIPRDTYYYRKGHETADKKKFNAIYGDDGVDGTLRAMSELLGGIPIEYYFKVTYTGVERIVDSLGGVKVNVPMNMAYDDPYAVPELHIHLNKGPQVLDGKKTMQFLRFRKNNDGTGYPEGDLGRIKAQQQFMKEAMKKALSFKLPVVANTVVKYVNTNMPLAEILGAAKDAVGISSEDIQTYSLPGRSTDKGVSYFLHSPDEVEKLMIDIYKNHQE
ncbi:MAG: LCP family protein [Bacillota bacterium]